MDTYINWLIVFLWSSSLFMVFFFYGPVLNTVTSWHVSVSSRASLLLIKNFNFLIFPKNFWVSLFKPFKNFCYFNWNTVISQINLNRTNILMTLTLPNLVCYFDSLLHKRITILWHWHHLGTGWKCRVSGHLSNQKLLVTRSPVIDCLLLVWEVLF